MEDEPTVREHDEPVTGVLDVGHDVGRQDCRRAPTADIVDQRRQEVAAGERIETGQRLVEEEQWRARPEREGEAHLRLFAARQLGDLTPSCEPCPLNARERVGTVKGLSRGPRHVEVVADGEAPVQRRRLRDVADRVHRPGAILRRVDAIDEDAPLVRPLEGETGPD